MNRLLLSARMLERSAPRFTPAGLPALDIVLRHEGEVGQDGAARKVSLEIRALAVGAVQAKVGALALGSEAVFGGYLAPGRNGRGLLFNVIEVEPTAQPTP